jgi:hypothetical protein
MKLLLKDNIPFIKVTVAYKGAEIEITDILIDTGSGTTILSTDIVVPIHIVPSPEDILHTIRGVGGVEVVFRRTLDYFQIGDYRLSNFPVDIGGMDYGFEINGILGMDFLTNAGAILNLRDMNIEFTDCI